MCGDKIHDYRHSHASLGSPPHVRGQESPSFIFSIAVRITPACAGTSVKRLWPIRGKRDHPRMCGDKGYRRLRCEERDGSPPHVRGQVFQKGCVIFMPRITPACAGTSGEVGLCVTN